MRTFVAWRGGLFLKEGEIGVLSVSSQFLTQEGVYVGVCVCIRTHTTHGIPGCEPVGRDETPGGPEESGWTKSRHICIRMCEQRKHLYVYARTLRRDEILEQLFLFFNIVLLLPTKKSKRCEHQTTDISNLK